MSTHFVTQTLEEKIPLWLLCSNVSMRSTLTTLLQAAGFATQEVVRGNTIPYAVVVVDLGDIPQAARTTIETLPKDVKRIWISFDGITSQSREGDGEMTTTLLYQGVFIPSPEPVSSLDTLARSLVFDDVKVREGNTCAPLWYEDVCEHMVRMLTSGKLRSGQFVSDQHMDVGALVLALQTKLAIQKGRGEKSYIVPPIHGTPLSARAPSAFLEQIAAYYDELHPREKEEEKGVASVAVSSAGVSPPLPVHHTHVRFKPTAKKRFRMLLVTTSFMCGSLLAGGYIWYKLDVGGLQRDLHTLAYTQPSTLDASFFRTTKQRLSRLQMLSSISDTFFSWSRQGRPSDLGEALPLISLGVEGSESLKNAQTELGKASEMIVKGSEGEDVATHVRTADQALDTAYKDFSLLQARFVQNDASFPDLMGGKDLQAQVVSQLPLYRKNITTLRSVIGIMPTLLYDSKPHTYALVLEDSTNLRGSGGVAEAVALLTFERGKPMRSQVYSTTALTRMLTGTVVAPDEVQAYLQVPTWTLADATWDVSFHKVTQNISWFLGKQLQRPIDGVMVLPSAALPSILSGTGPLILPGNQDRIDGDTVASRISTTLGLLPQNPVALDSLYTNLLSALISSFQQGSTSVQAKTLSAMLTELSDSNVFISVGDTEAQRTLTALGWDGMPLTPACPPTFADSSCRVSTAYESEVNLGENNINAFIKRSQIHTIRLEKDVLLQTRLITLTNTSTQEAWPFGTYRGLVKLLVDETAQLQSVTINDHPLPPDQIGVTKEDGKFMISFRVEVPITTTDRIRIIYTTPGIASQKSSLVFFEQKQAGADEDPFTLVISYPDAYTPKSVAPRADVGRSSLTFSAKHDQNRLYGIGF